MKLFLYLITSLFLVSCATYSSLPPYKSISSSYSKVIKTGPNRDISSSTPPFDWPVYQAQITQFFKPEGSGSHFGIDLSAPKHSPILAAHDGYVLYAGSEFSGYGRFIIIENESGWASFYGHCQKLLVKTGEKIKQGEVIATMGRTGRSTGVHLHFELRKDKVPVDPLLFLPGGRELR